MYHGTEGLITILVPIRNVPLDAIIFVFLGEVFGLCVLPASTVQIIN
jgi:hypothetical protein